MKAKERLIQMVGKEEAEQILEMIRNAREITFYKPKEELDD